MEKEQKTRPERKSGATKVFEWFSNEMTFLRAHIIDIDSFINNKLWAYCELATFSLVISEVEPLTC